MIRSLLARIEAATSGYLAQVGWIRTRAERVARDATGDPIPWFTYPAVRLLGDRTQKGWRVLEYGAGMGTLWWSCRVDSVVAVEHDAAWADRISASSSAKIIRASAQPAEQYVQAASEAAPYDMIIVDGIHRNECLEQAPRWLTPAGVIILDDAQREEYRPGIEAVRRVGFRVLELHGPQPVSKHPGCTAILYRSNNVLAL